MSCALYPARMLEIIPENPDKHAAAIEALYDVTFGPGHFAKTAERLREGNVSLPEITRVAVKDGTEIVGVCRIWPIRVGDESVSAVLVGPVAVTPSMQGSRLGLTVTGEAIEAATKAGYDAALLVGITSYFSEIGFTIVEPDQVKLPGPVDYARVMVRDLAMAGGGAALKGDVRV